MSDRTNWQRRQAMMIAAQLPEDPKDVWGVLAFVVILATLSSYTPQPPAPQGKGKPTVVSFSRLRKDA